MTHRSQYGLEIIHHTDLVSTIYGLATSLATDLLRYNIRTCNRYIIRTWTRYGLDGKSVYCQHCQVRMVSSLKTQVRMLSSPYIVKIIFSQDIVRLASPYVVGVKTIYGLGQVRMLFFVPCDEELTFEL